MEQETKQKPWTGIAAGVLVLCLILSLALSDGGARAASAGAVLELPGAAEGLSRSQAPRWGTRWSPWAGRWESSCFPTACWWWACRRWRRTAVRHSPGTDLRPEGRVMSSPTSTVTEVDTIEEVQDILGDGTGGCR